MAKWEEKDPRWIVSEREDGVNVSGWHWQEKNRMSWAKERLNELLPGIEATIAAEEKKKRIRVAAVSSVEGDATQSTRKGGKKMSCYDLKLELAWVAFDDDDDDDDDDGDDGGDDAEEKAGEKEEEEQGKEEKKENGDVDGDGKSNGDGNKKEKKKKKRKNEIKGDLKVLEVTTGHDEDDILFEATVTGSAAKELSAREAAEALKRPVLDVIAAFASELEALEL